MTVVASVEPVAETAMRKIGWRILPVVSLMYLVAFLDRANVAYAKLTMTADLGFSEAVYGFGAGVFFVGYLLLQIPGALIVERRGARRLFAVILITWGLCASLVGLIKTPSQFYVTRFFLGVAEAGLFPGVVVYLNQWFPSRYRARALSVFFLSGTIALMIGGPISGWILKYDWFGKPGWRWVFILEAVPAVLLGLITLLVVTDRPEQATWLKPEERDWVCRELQAEKRQKRSLGRITTWQALRQHNVLILAMMTFLANIATTGFFLWLPTTVYKASGLPPYLSAAVSGLPFGVAVASQLFFGWTSDRTGELYLHTALPMILAGLIFPITTLKSLSFGWLLFWLCVSSAAIYAPVSQWVLPTVTLGESAAAAAIGFINIFSGLGSFVGPTVVGKMLTARYSFSVAVFLLSLTLIGAGAMTFALDRGSSNDLSQQVQPSGG